MEESELEEGEACSFLNHEEELDDASIDPDVDLSYISIKSKQPEMTNFGFPASDVGGLQVIKNCDLEKLIELGSRTFGTVYHGKWRGTDVVIKRITDRCFARKPSEQERMVYFSLIMFLSSLFPCPFSMTNEMVYIDYLFIQ
ncbi:uncharacterized protein LOC107609939 isoform X1 [Arachis ipaensis]|uniref:Protein kinase domain-containing protein n=1 Tax=Arachis hypogaea TaxID=3818 RepID=A0A444Y9B7_ARAHY|nr:uncharacterized protein LOC107609939 isoform X1 [Arachis ipaensis]XP_025667580.1 uncharacterized protein LOC112765927 isoform X1 [Arachis hypogaea]RYQ98534.1 hypothetical protein Ahy_B07g086273 isoform B [Arachis hypogaea]